MEKNIFFIFKQMQTKLSAYFELQFKVDAAVGKMNTFVFLYSAKKTG